MILNILKREGREEQAYARFNVYSSAFTSFVYGIFLFFQVPVVIDQDRLVVKSVQLMKVPQEHPTLTFLR